MTTGAVAGRLELPRLGIGTWRMGEDRSRRAEERRALEHALESGVRLVDTAEMYGEGQAERLVGDALRGRRDGVTIVTKIYPWNASRSGVPRAAEASLERLGIDVIDLYLLHWAGRHPLSETIDAFETLRAAGKIRSWGVSNFDTRSMKRARAVPGGEQLAANQVLYNLEERGIEWDLIGACAEDGVRVMAYTPLGSGRLVSHPAVARVARELGAPPARVATAWTIRHEGVVTIPKSASVAHVDELLGADRLVLPGDALAALDEAFPPPRGPAPLATL